MKKKYKLRPFPRKLTKKMREKIRKKEAELWELALRRWARENHPELANASLGRIEGVYWNHNNLTAADYAVTINAR